MSAQGLIHLTECEDSVKTVEDISHFMLSTINRGLDYTKASSGIALAASNSTFHLNDALYWAVNCICRANEDSNVRLEAIPTDICEYIVSDQQVKCDWIHSEKC